MSNNLPSKIIIYGKEDCPFCVRAKKLSSHLKEHHPNIEVEYHDIMLENLSKEDLAAIMGIEEVKTVPQIQCVFENNVIEYMGGFDSFYDKADTREWF